MSKFPQLNHTKEEMIMILGGAFELFVKAAPISVMMRAIGENTFNSHRIDETFNQTAECQYTRILHFRRSACDE